MANEVNPTATLLRLALLAGPEWQRMAIRTLQRAGRNRTVAATAEHLGISEPALWKLRARMAAILAGSAKK